MTYSVAFPFIILLLYWSSFKNINYVENSGKKSVSSTYNFEMYLKRLKECEGKIS